MQAVIARVGSAQNNTADAHGFAGGHVLVVKAGGLAIGQHIAAHHVAGGSRHRGGGGAVIDLVGTGVADGQSLGRDIGSGCRCRVGQRVVTHVGTTGQRNARHVDGLVTHVLVGETGCLAEADCVTGNDVGRAARYRYRGRAVVHLVLTGVAHGNDGFRRDAACAAGRRAAQVVIGGIRARQAQAIERVGRRADVFAVERATRTGDAQHVAALQVAHSGRAVGHCRAVITLDHIAGRQARLQGVDGQVAVVDHGAVEVGACLAECGAADGVVAYLQVAAGALVPCGAGRLQGKGSRAADQVIKDISVACHTGLGQGVDRAAALVLHHWRVTTGAAIGGRAVTCFHQQLQCRDDGEIAIRIADVVVGRCQPRWSQHGIGACCSRRAARVGTRNRQCATQFAAGLTRHKATVLHASGAGKGRVCFANELGIVVGRDGQSCLSDVAGQCGRLQQVVVAGIGTGQGVGSAYRLAISGIFVGKQPAGIGRQGQRIAAQRRDAAPAHAGQCSAVVHLVGGGGAGHVQVRLGDIRAGSGGEVAHRVVALGTTRAQRNAGHVDGFGGAHILVGEVGGLCEAHRVATDHIGRASRYRGRGRAVIHLGGAGIGHHQCFGSDVGRGRGCGTGQAVVACVRATLGDAGDVDALGRAHVVIRKRRSLRKAHVVTTHDVSRRRSHTGVCRAVIDLAVAHIADGERLGGDVRGRAGQAAAQAVVAGIGATERDAADIHGLAIGHVLVAERRRLAVGQRVAGHLVGGTAGHAGGRVAVVHLVGCCVAGRQSLGCDVAGGAGRGRGKAVVASICAAQPNAGDVDGLAVAHVLVGKRRGLAEAHHIAVDDVGGGARHSRCGRTVIHLVGSGVAGVQGFGGDVGRAAGCGVLQAVIAGIGTGQGDCCHVNGFGGAHVFSRTGHATHVSKCCAAAKTEVVAAHHLCRAASHGGAGCCVIHLVGTGKGSGQVFYGDVGAGAGY